MLRQKIPIRVRRIGGARLLPVALFRKLRDPRAGLGGELTVRMVVEKLAVAFDRIGGFRGPLVLLLAAAGSHEKHKNGLYRESSCAECEHHRHPRPGGTGYSRAARSSRRESRRYLRKMRQDPGGIV